MRVDANKLWGKCEREDDLPYDPTVHLRAHIWISQHLIGRVVVNFSLIQ